MTVRSYSGLLLLETLFDSVPTSNADLTTLCNNVFSPFVLISEEDCGTMLGENSPVNYELEGKVELSTGEVISRDRIETLLTNGKYFVPTRSLSTCVSKEGVCKSCYSASRQKDPEVEVGSYIQIFPEYQVAADTTSVIEGDTQISLSQDIDMYDRLYVYYKGVLLSNDSYTISGTTLKFVNPIMGSGQILTRFTTITRAPFLAWLADTYSGAMLGLKALPSPKLPIRKRLLSGLIPMSMVELLATQASKVPSIPLDSISYLDNITDPLEKALFVIALLSVYLNVF